MIYEFQIGLKAITTYGWFERPAPPSTIPINESHNQYLEVWLMYKIKFTKYSNPFIKPR